MKLLTYNFLTSKCIRGVKVGYPLKLNITEKRLQTAEFNPEFISKMLPRLDWPAIRVAAGLIGCEYEFPELITDESTADQDFLQKVHHILLEIDIVEGQLECPETGRIFPINAGIPNMLLNEDEV